MLNIHRDTVLTEFLCNVSGVLVVFFSLPVLLSALFFQGVLRLAPEEEWTPAVVPHFLEKEVIARGRGREGRLRRAMRKGKGGGGGYRSFQLTCTQLLRVHTVDATTVEREGTFIQCWWDKETPKAQESDQMEGNFALLEGFPQKQSFVSVVVSHNILQQ